MFCFPRPTSSAVSTIRVDWVEWCWTCALPHWIGQSEASSCSMALLGRQGLLMVPLDHVCHPPPTHNFGSGQKKQKNKKKRTTNSEAKIEVHIFSFRPLAPGLGS